MLACSQCGHHNKDMARYCARCGALLHVARGTYVALQSGQRLKKDTYTIEQQLGKGGMGAVYLGSQIIAGHKRDIVVKELLDYVHRVDFRTQAEYDVAVQKARQRFEEEAATLAGLNHTGIPGIYDYFTEKQRNYIVMECIAGRDLRQRLTHTDELGRTLAGQPSPLPVVLRWGIELCKVLEYLERQTPPMMHHDIKPANIILDANSGTVRLVDFGTAKARLVAQPGGRMGVQKSSIYGTSGYAAPEMYQQTSTPRSDVYSLAATLYHLLTDDDPRDHPFAFPQLAQLPQDVVQALKWALADDPAQRPTATQFRARLEFIAQPAISAVSFTFENGETVQKPEEIVPLCDHYWDEALDYLREGDFQHWFRRMNRNDLTAALRDSQQLRDVDAQLETLLHRLEPGLRHPRIMPDTTLLDFGTVAQNGEVTQYLTLTLIHRGYARATVDARQPWLTVEPREVQLWHSAGKTRRARVAVRARTAGLPVGRHQGVAVEVTCTQRTRAIAAEIEIAFWPTVLAKLRRLLGNLLQATITVVGRVLEALGRFLLWWVGVPLSGSTISARQILLLIVLLVSLLVILFGIEGFFWETVIFWLIVTWLLGRALQ